MSTIDVHARLVLHQDDVFAFKDETGFLLEGDGEPQLINEGRLSLAQSSADALMALVSSTADGAVFWNKAEGVVDFRAAESAGPEVFPLQLTGAETVLRNDGRSVFQAEREVIAALFASHDGRFINTGLWQVSAGDEAGGGYFRVQTIVNSGRFLVSGDVAFGAYMLGSPAADARFDNSGLIRISGLINAACVSLRDIEPTFHLNNSGRMVAQSFFPSIGVTMPVVGYAVITNSGLIRADRAIWGADGPGGGELLNSGRVIGDVIFADGSDTVQNAGLIRGDVQLGDGWDHFDGRGGVLHGVVWGGLGDDTLIGGAGGEELHGDEALYSSFLASDLLKGGGGDDSLFGGAGTDTLQGGKGADLLYGEDGADLQDGGKGADVYVFTALSQSAPDGADTIAGWHGDDWIDLSSIDADADTPGDQAFSPDQVTVSFDGASGETRIELDADRDGTADFVLIIASGHFSLDHLVL